MCLKTGTIDLTGIEKNVQWDELFSLPKDYWVEDHAETRHFLETELGTDMPPEVQKEIDEQELRIKNMKWSGIRSGHAKLLLAHQAPTCHYTK